MAWQKGMKSPNPGGRPKRGTGLTELLREVGQQTKDGRKRAALLAERVWDEALKGQQWAAVLIYNRLEGLPVARHEKDELVKVEVSYVEVHRAEITGAASGPGASNPRIVTLERTRVREALGQDSSGHGSADRTGAAGAAVRLVRAELPLPSGDVADDAGHATARPERKE